MFGRGIPQPLHQLVGSQRFGGGNVRKARKVGPHVSCGICCRHAISGLRLWDRRGEGERLADRLVGFDPEAEKVGKGEAPPGRVRPLVAARVLAGRIPDGEPELLFGWAQLRVGRSIHGGCAGLVKFRLRMWAAGLHHRALGCRLRPLGSGGRDGWRRGQQPRGGHRRRLGRLRGRRTDGGSGRGRGGPGCDPTGLRDAGHVEQAGGVLVEGLTAVP